MAAAVITYDGGGRSVATKNKNQEKRNTQKTNYDRLSACTDGGTFLVLEWFAVNQVW